MLRLSDKIMIALVLLVFVGGVTFAISRIASSTASRDTNSGTAQTAKNGGVIDLPAGEKLLSGGFAFGNTSLLTRPMRPGETPETHNLFVVQNDDAGTTTRITIREHAADEKK